MGAKLSTKRKKKKKTQQQPQQPWLQWLQQQQQQQWQQQQQQQPWLQYLQQQQWQQQQPCLQYLQQHLQQQQQAGRYAETSLSYFEDFSLSTYEIYDAYDTSDAYEEKCYDPQDRTLTFVDGEDDLDFECNDYKSLRAKMSCGHAVTPMSLTSWCRRLLDEGECKFVCGQTNCDAQWSFDEVCKMALLTPQEKDEFEKKLFSNAAKNYLNIKACPGCKSKVWRTDLTNLNVECTVCSATKNRTYRFCWQCLNEWKGPAPRSDRCDNPDCQSPLDILRSCPAIVFNDVKGVRGCPSIRACPSCGLLVEHNKNQCKSMTCPRCKVKFCFVCLKVTDRCLKQYPYDPCPDGVAPRQTSIPVWKT